MTDERILVVEDEESILMALKDDLAFEGYRVESAMDGESGLAKALDGDFDLVILDVMLPGLDGFQICRRIRAEGRDMPVMMLTAKGQEVDKVLGLELGADDYVTKPFSPRELVARIRALLRRSSRAPAEAHRVRFGDIEVDFKKFETKRDGEVLDLTAREYSLLKFLIDRRDRAVSRYDILQGVWPDDADVFPRTVDTHIANLRKKLERNPAEPRHIVGVRSVGYRFAEDSMNS